MRSQLMSPKIFFAGFFSALISITITTNTNGNDRDEAESLVSGCIANIDAIQTFDLLWRRESELLTESGVLESFMTIGRLAVDPEDKKCMSVKHDKHSQTMPSKTGAVDRTREALLAVVSDGKDSWGRQIPNAASRMNSNFERILIESGGPCIYGMGLSSFPVSYEEAISAQHYHDFLRQGNVAFGMRNLGNNTASISWSFENEKSKDVRAFVIDVNQMVITSSRYSVIMKSKGESVPQFVETYQYQERNRLQLPVKIIGEKRHIKRTDDKIIVGSESYTVDLHWFSVNEKLDSSRFSSPVLLDVNQLMGLIKQDVFIPE